MSQAVVFLHMLYYIVGATYTQPRQTDSHPRIAAYAEKGRMVKHGDIKKWVGEVDSLLKGRKKYDYNDWRGGKLAGYEFT